MIVDLFDRLEFVDSLLSSQGCLVDTIRFQRMNFHLVGQELHLVQSTTAVHLLFQMVHFLLKFERKC